MHHVSRRRGDFNCAGSCFNRKVFRACDASGRQVSHRLLRPRLPEGWMDGWVDGWIACVKRKGVAPDEKVGYDAGSVTAGTTRRFQRGG